MLSKLFLKRITEAHSWLGLIISGLLFVVFFCGSIAIYRHEITQWAVQPHYSFAEGEQKPISEIMAIAIEGENFDAQEHLALILPTEAKPYYSVYVDVHHEKGAEDHISFIIDPVSGEKLNHVEQFFLADFIYKLHYDLNFSAGSYVIGLVALLLLFAIISGVFIHAKKIVSNFFKYRTHQTKRTKLLDVHNVIGVMSLPFTFMYAISGLMFNLAIIYQIAFAVVLYKGDQQALLDDAGYAKVTAVWTDKAWENPPIDTIIDEVSHRENHIAQFVRVHNYGDESAVIEVIGSMDEQIGGRFSSAVAVSTLEKTVLNDPINSNMVRKGLQVVANLHYGNYAGFDLRLLYFILGISVCVLIVAGNLLWIDKRSRQRTHSTRSVNIARKYTLFSTAGVIFATSVAFLLERTLPIDLNARDSVLIYGFCTSLVLSGIASIWCENIKVCLANLLKASGLIGVILVAYDVVFFGNKILELAANGHTNSVWTDAAILALSVLSFYLAKGLIAKDKQVRNEALENVAIA